MKVVLVRSPAKLLEANEIGFGWPWEKFCEFSNAQDLIKKMKSSEHKPGRHKNQIIRYFDITDGDIVLVPLPYSFALATATSEKCFEKGVDYGENRIRVKYLRDKSGKVIRTPRGELSQGLSARLRIRQTVASLEDYQDEVFKIFKDIEASKLPYGRSGAVDAEETRRRSELSDVLLSNLKNGDTWIKAGGDGLELIVKELLDAEGYITEVPAKNSEVAGADVDIIAQSKGRLSYQPLLIQVKHHKGETNSSGINQLINTKHDGVKWLITSATLSESADQKAKESGIEVMDGEGLVEWILDSVALLKPETLHKLGLSVVPQVLEKFVSK